MAEDENWRDRLPPRHEQTPEERLQYMSMKLADRLGNIEGRQDLFSYFMDKENWVPVSVLLMDKSLRRTAFRDAPDVEGLGRGHSAFQYMLRAAEEHQDLSIKGHGPGAETKGGPCVRLNDRQLPKVVEEAKRRVDAESVAHVDTPNTAQESVTTAPALPLEVAEPQRNCKGELAQLVAKRLQRAMTKDDVRYEAWKLSERDQVPKFKAQCMLFGETYEGRSIHGNKKAAEQDAALVALEALQNEAPDEKDGAASVTTVVQEVMIDYKGQLLKLFQTLGKDKDVRFDVFRVNEDSEEKYFQAKVFLPIPGQDPICGHPMSRSDFESSEKTRRAAQQDAAQRALQVLNGTASDAQPKPKTRDIFAPAPRAEVREVDILWLPLDRAEMVRLRRVQVVKDDFLSTVEAQLKCDATVSHPLTWMGNRPRGLSLYEAVLPPAKVNQRATALAGVEIFGDSLLMDASAHTKGAALIDITLPRYEQLKADRAGHLDCPVIALNQNRGMMLWGHPKLPETYSGATWVGRDPKSLLIEVARRRNFNPPQIEVYAYQSDAHPEGGWWRASASISNEKEEKWSYGEPSTNKMDTQHDASLKVMQQLQSEDEAGRWRHPLLETLLPRARELLQTRGLATPFVRGSKVTLSYEIKITKATSQDTIELTLERQERLTAAVTGRVLHPVLQELLQTLTIGGEVSTSGPCVYEDIACDFHFHLQLLDLQLPIEPELPKKVIKFDPPLWKQRQKFIVQALLCRSVKSILDLGCGDGQLLEALLLESSFDRLCGLELSEIRVKNAQKRLSAYSESATSTAVMCGDFVAPGQQGAWMSFAAGVEAIVLCEVLEHLPEASMPRLPHALFALQPQVVIVTSPNADFGDSDSEDEEDHAEGAKRAFRHADHEREWTRAEFKEWSERVAREHGYWISELDGVGRLPGMEANGPCTQLCIFERREEELDGDLPTSASSFAEEMDPQHMVTTALRAEELGGEGSGLWKYVHQEGTGDLPPARARVNLHYASYLSSGLRVETSREKNRSTPCAFQLGGKQALLAWQLCAASMKPGEIAWLCSPPNFAYGEGGVPPSVPPNETMWFALELNFAKAPGTVKFSQCLEGAMEEAERHMEVGRRDLKRQAFAQGRQAFRRARVALPEKLLLNRSEEEIARFATLERAALLNQALCCLKLGDSVDPTEGVQHFRDALAAADELLQRHGDADGDAAKGDAPQSIPELQAILRRVSGAVEGTWRAKAYFRRGTARERLQYLADAIEDYEAALKIEPGDKIITKQLSVLRNRQRKAELKPEKMFAGILQRERMEREKEEAAADLAARKQRREERLKAEAEAA